MAHILLLEPDAVLARLYCAAFEHAGHTWRHVVSAQDAIFHVDERLPDIVVVELQLVAHSGIEFLYELRSYQEWQAIPAIVHSCIPPTEFTGSAQLLRSKLGVGRYLYKPHTTLQALLRSVQDVAQLGQVADMPVETERGPAAPMALRPIPATA